MRNDEAHLKLRVASLKELDALVGKYLTKEAPQVFWEEEHACLRFESIEEALEAMRDPYFQLFIPADARANTALKEVQEFRGYSSDLALAWEVIERISPHMEPLHVRCHSGLWYVAFGQQEESSSRSAPVAICLAALRANGMDVDFSAERKSMPGSGERAVA
jgi:hypothetical protein